MVYHVYEVRQVTTYARFMYKISATSEDEALEQAQNGDIEATECGELDYVDYGESGWAVRTGDHNVREAFAEASAAGNIGKEA